MPLGRGHVAELTTPATKRRNKETETIKCLIYSITAPGTAQKWRFKFSSALHIQDRRNLAHKCLDRGTITEG